MPNSTPLTSTPSPLRLLITAGPTHEPIDSVRFIGNRSSGRLGIAIAEAAARRKIRGDHPSIEPNSSANLKPDSPPASWQVTLALGPTALTPSDSSVRVLRFRTAADLQALLAVETPLCHILIMAAAVADYRPKPSLPAAADPHQGKIRRTDQPLTLELEPTPDLLAGVAAHRRPGQLLVGFALEPLSRLVDSALSKLERKKIDLIVANPLETMDAPEIQAMVIAPRGVIFPPPPTRPYPQSKEAFAESLLDLLDAEFRRNALSKPTGA